MPNNDFTITSIVDQSAFEQLDRLAGQFDTLKQKYADIATAIGKGISMPAGTIDELNVKMQQFNTNGQEMAKVQQQLTEMQQKYEQLLADVNRKVAEATRASAEYARTSATLEKAYRQLGQSQSDEALELAMVREKTRQANQEIKNQAKLLIANEKNANTASKSYNQLSAEYSLLKQKINDMSMAERQAAEGRELEQHLLQIHNQMKELQEATGVYSLNVGNYANSIRDAFGLSGPMGEMFEKIITAGPKASDTFKAMGTSVKAMGASLKSLLANPIVATIAAIAGVVMLVSKGISSSEENMQKWRKITAPMNMLLGKLLNILQKAVGWLLDMAMAVGKVVSSVLRLMENLPIVGKYIKQFNDASVQAVRTAGDQGTKEETEDNTVEDEKEKYKAIAAIRKEDAKSAEELAREREQAASKETAEIADRYAFQAAAYAKAMNDEITAEVSRYEKGEINKEQFEAKKAEIEQRYAEESANLAIQLIEEQLKVENLSNEERIRLSRQLAEAQNNLDKLMTDNRIKAANDATEAAKKAAEEQERLAKEAADKEREMHQQQLQQQQEYEQQRMELIQQSVQTMTALFSGIADIISNHYDQQLKELEKSTDAQQSRIERLAELGAITTEEAEARKRAAEEATEAKREEIMKKQADAQKAANIANTIMNTAVAIMKAWSQGGIFAAPMAALIAAQGAIQLATIMSTKAYAEGTNYAAGGLSIVGDGGRPELVLSRGKAWITPDTPTLVNLQRGDKVLPDAQAVLTGKMMSDYAMLSEQLKDKRDEGVTVNIANDHNDLRREMELSNEQLERIEKILRKQAHNADYMRIYARV
jgi:myosin heavy subunit